MFCSYWRSGVSSRLSRKIGRATGLRDDILIEISRLRPHSNGALARIRNLNEHTARVHGKHILKLVSSAARREPGPVPTQQRLQGKPSNMQEALADVLHGTGILYADVQSMPVST